MNLGWATATGSRSRTRVIMAGSMLLLLPSFVVSVVGNLLLMTMVPGIARNEICLHFIILCIF